MHDEADEADGRPQSLPASMADIFLALVGVVVIMLLSLAPALEDGSAPAPHSDGSEEVAAFVAEAQGLRVAGRTALATPLAAIVGSRALADILRAAAGDGRDVVLLIEPRGHEAAFLFGALAYRVGLGRIRQIRLAEPCGRPGDAAVMKLCAGGSPEAGR